MVGISGDRHWLIIQILLYTTSCRITYHLLKANIIQKTFFSSKDYFRASLKHFLIQIVSEITKCTVLYLKVQARFLRKFHYAKPVIPECQVSSSRNSLQFKKVHTDSFWSTFKALLPAIWKSTYNLFYLWKNTRTREHMMINFCYM